MVVAMAQPARRASQLEAATNKSHGLWPGGGKKNKVTVALPQRKGNDSGGMAHGRRQLGQRRTEPRAVAGGVGRGHTFDLSPGKPLHYD